MEKSTLINIIRRFAIFLFVLLGPSIIILILPVENIYNSLLNTNDEASALTQTNAISMFLVYLIVLIISLLIFWKNNILNLFKSFKNKQVIKDGITIGIIILAVTMTYNLLLSLIPNYGSNSNEQSVESIISINPLLSFFTVGIFAPIVEELGYRYGLFGGLRKFSKIAAYIVTIIVFAFLHFNITENMSAQDILNEFLNLPTYLFAAFMLSYAYDRHSQIAKFNIPLNGEKDNIDNDVLATNITAHAVNNLTAVLAEIIVMIMAQVYV